MRVAPIRATVRPAARLIVGLAVALAPIALGGRASAGAESWPQRPVKIVVPFAAGGNIDGIARLIAQPLGAALGQQFLVEARPGANGAIAGEAVARAPADGYTLFLATTAQIAVAPAVAKTPYDSIKDFAPICGVTSNPFVLAVSKALGVATVADFVAHVRARPGQLSYGSGGIGSLSHLTSALFLKRAGLDMAHAVYKGGAPALVDLLAGHVQMYSANLSEVMTYADSPDIKLLAVSSLTRTPQLPNVPTVAESGYPGYESVTWSGLLAPAQTPTTIVDRVAAACLRTVRDPSFQERVKGFGAVPMELGPADLARRIKADIPFWAAQVKIAGAAVD